MDRNTFDQRFRPRLERLCTTNLSDAMDLLGIRGAVIGIRPMFDAPRVVGRAVTIKITAAGMTKSKTHLGIEAIASAEPGDVIAIDNRGDLNNNCWGEVLACAAKVKGVCGVVVDGAARDLDACREMAFPVYARGAVPITARGRIMQEAFNCMIRLGDVQVRPGDVIVGDINGVVVICEERLEDVVREAEILMQKEEQMKADLLAGMDVLEMDRKYNYEQMLKK
ncbi:MAG: RraA family protein [Burkholderiales bacterium]|jgi:regulator of RNase E activity RraA